MKRILLVALMLSSLVFSASGEEYVNTFKNARVFSVTYDTGFFELDDTMYKGDNTASYEWCFTLISDDCSVNCEMEYVPEYKDFSLFSSSDDKIREYADMLCNINSDYNCEYVETYKITVTNGNRKAILPFIILHMNDSYYGETYYAETMTNGYAIFFEIFDYNTNRPNVSKKQILLSLIDTFMPVI